MSPSGPDKLSLIRPLFGKLAVVVGSLAVILGLVMLLLPRHTLAVVAFLFGVQLVILGVERVALGIKAPTEAGALKKLLITLGVLSVVAGIVCFLHPSASLFVLAIFLAVGWIVDGIASLTQAAGSQRSGGHRVWLVVSGVVSIVAALIVVIFPGTSLKLLAQVAGAALLVIGLAQLLSAAAIRRSNKEARQLAA